MKCANARSLFTASHSPGHDVNMVMRVRSVSGGMLPQRLNTVTGGTESSFYKYLIGYIPELRPASVGRSVAHTECSSHHIVPLAQKASATGAGRSTKPVLIAGYPLLLHGDNSKSCDRKTIAGLATPWQVSCHCVRSSTRALAASFDIMDPSRIK